jgi:hypothetical protein
MPTGWKAGYFHCHRVYSQLETAWRQHSPAMMAVTIHFWRFAMFDDYGLLFTLGLAVSLVAGLVYYLSGGNSQTRG